MKCNGTVLHPGGIQELPERTITVSTQHLYMNMITLTNDLTLQDSRHKPDTEIAHYCSQQTDHSIAFTHIWSKERWVWLGTLTRCLYPANNEKPELFFLGWIFKQGFGDFVCILIFLGVKQMFLCPWQDNSSRLLGARYCCCSSRHIQGFSYIITYKGRGVCG